MDVADEYTTLGYLIAIVSVLGFAIMPRAKFIQMMIFDLLAVGVAACLALLTMYSSVKARQHTDPTNSHVYNSSASAVSGVWLFFQIWLVHTFRAKYPQFQFPVIVYAIFANISSVYAPQMRSWAAAVGMIERMLKTFLTGLGVSTAVSLFILPMTSRTAVFKQMAGYIGGLQSALGAHAAYFETLEKDDMFGRAETYDDSREKIGKKGKVYSPEAEAIRDAIRGITDLHAKLHGDLTFAKREFALGKLGPDDIQCIFRHLRQIMIPVVGLSFVVDIFQRLSDYNKWNEPIDPNIEPVSEDVRHRVVRDWNDIMRAVHDPFATMIQTIDEGLQHSSYVLRLTKPPKRTATSNITTGNTGLGKDVEASAESTAPGEKEFAAHFEQKLGQFRSAKRIALQTWAEEKGVTLPPGFFDHPSSVDSLKGDFFDASASHQDRSRRQLYLFLYVRPSMLPLTLLTTDSNCRWNNYSTPLDRQSWILCGMPTTSSREESCPALDLLSPVPSDLGNGPRASCKQGTTMRTTIWVTSTPTTTFWNWVRRTNTARTLNISRQRPCSRKSVTRSASSRGSCAHSNPRMGSGWHAPR